MPSSIESSDAEAAYDWNSDDEPPVEIVHQRVVTSHDGEVWKQILRTGKDLDRPSYGDLVQVRWKPLNGESVDFKEARAKETISGLLRCNASVVDEVVSALLNVQAEGVELGFNERLPSAVEESLRSMRAGEISLVVCKGSSRHTEIVSNSYMKEDRKSKYQVFHKKQLKAKRKCLRRLRREVDDPDSCNFLQLQKNGLNEFEERHRCFIVHLDGFQKRFALDDRRSIVKEVLIPAPPYNPSPAHGDWVLYLYREEEGESLAEWKTFQGRLVPENATFISSCAALSSMREGERCRVLINLQLVGDGEDMAETAVGPKWSTAYTLNGKLSNAHILTYSVVLLRVLKAGVISVESETNGPGFVFHYQEILPCQKGVKRQMAVEEGCRVASLVSVRVGGVSTLASGPVHLLSWTVGRGAVPDWLEALVTLLQPGRRLRAVCSAAEEGTKHQSSQCSAVLPDARAWCLSSGSGGEILTQDDAGKETGRQKWQEYMPEEFTYWDGLFLCDLQTVGLTLEPWTLDLSAVSLDTALSGVIYVSEGGDGNHEVVVDKRVDGVRLLSALLGECWNPFSGSRADMAVLREWLMRNSRAVGWQEIVEPVRKVRDEETDLCRGHHVVVDIQLIDVVERSPEPWILGEAQRLAWVEGWKHYGSKLYQQRRYKSAIAAFHHAENVLRFSEHFDRSQIQHNQPSQSLAALPRVKDVVTALAPNRRGIRRPTIGLSSSPLGVVDLRRRLGSNVMQCYMCLEQWLTALRHGLQAVEWNGFQDTKLFYRIAMCYFQLQEFEECQEALNYAFVETPRDPALLVSNVFKEGQREVLMQERRRWRFSEPVEAR